MTLHGRDRWLLIFDNVERPEGIAGWLPAGDGHVLITSRAPNWHDLAIPIEVDVFTRAESITTLRHRVPHLSEADAAQVAESVGDLPLAIAQAAGYMALTDIPPRDYVHLLSTRPADVLDLGKPWAYPQSLASATTVSLDRIRAEDPAAAEVATICAFLAPEPIPAAWFPHATDCLSKPLAESAGDAITWHRVIARLRRSNIVRVSDGSLLMHRLTQAIIRDRLSLQESAAARDLAANVLTANHPDTEGMSINWSAWERLLPHLVTFDHLNSENENLRQLGLDGILYLIVRGDASAAANVARHAYDQCRAKLGDDARDTLRFEYTLAYALQESGDLEAARDLNEGTLRRSRRILGEDHPDTLWSATILASAHQKLGDLEAARELHQDVLIRRRRVLGEDHPDTLRGAMVFIVTLQSVGDFEAARNLGKDVLLKARRAIGEDHPDTVHCTAILAATLRRLGDLEAARELHQDVLIRRSRVEGADHSDSLRFASMLAATLRGLGDFEAARDLEEDTLERCRRVLGENHPDTLLSASKLAEDLKALGEE